MLLFNSIYVPSMLVVVSLLGHVSYLYSVIAIIKYIFVFYNISQLIAGVDSTTEQVENLSKCVSELVELGRKNLPMAGLMEEEIGIIHDSCPSAEAIEHLASNAEPSDPISNALADCKRRMVEHFGKTLVEYLAEHYKLRSKVILDAEAVAQLTSQIEEKKEKSLESIRTCVQKRVTANGYETAVNLIKNQEKALSKSFPEIINGVCTS